MNIPNLNCLSMDQDGEALLDYDHRTQTLTANKDCQAVMEGFFQKGDRVQFNQPLEKMRDLLTQTQDKHDEVLKKMKRYKDALEKILGFYECKHHVSPSMDNPHGCTDCYNTGLVIDDPIGGIAYDAIVEENNENN